MKREQNLAKPIRLIRISHTGRDLPDDALTHLSSPSGWLFRPLLRLATLRTQVRLHQRGAKPPLELRRVSVNTPSVVGRYQLENGANGTDSFAVMGLQNRLPLTKQFRLSWVSARFFT